MLNSRFEQGKDPHFVSLLSDAPGVSREPREGPSTLFLIHCWGREVSSYLKNILSFYSIQETVLF